MGNAGFIPSTVGGVLGEAFEGFLPFEGWSRTCRAGLCGGIRLARFQEAAFQVCDSFALPDHGTSHPLRHGMGKCV